MSNTSNLFPSLTNAALKGSNLSDLTDKVAARGNLNKWVTKTTSYTAVSGDWIRAHTSGGSFTITLPASPADGDEVRIADTGHWAINALTIGRNGKTINGASADVTYALGGVEHTFRYVATDGNWEVFSKLLDSAAIIKLETIVANNDASLDFTTGFDDSKYSAYALEIDSLIGSTDNVDLAVRFSSDGGTTWETGNVYYNERLFLSSTAQSQNASTSTSARVTTGVGNVDAAEQGVVGMLKVFNLGDASKRTVIMGDARHRNASGLIYRVFTNTEFISSTADDAIQLLMSAGNIASGSATLFGIPK